MPLKEIPSGAVRARFNLTEISDMWGQFRCQAYEDPGETCFRVGQHCRWWQGKVETQDVLVRIDDHPDGRVATMLLADEF
jgi:hypothetical protein